ncbi:MAG TPA: hypothetical protein VLH10_00190 [Yinghuangia sp.]|nr:hypothetical protein [Yinghuangia sp.]
MAADHRRAALAVPALSNTAEAEADRAHEASMRSAGCFTSRDAADKAASAAASPVREQAARQLLFIRWFSVAFPSRGW